MINLSNRLTSIAKLVLKDENAKLIDVGCDHALLDIYLLQNNDKLKIVASDNKKAPLENAKKNIEKYSFLNKIEIRLQDGLDNLDNDIDTVVISGMGCETIIEILTRAKDKLKNVKRLIISSNNKYPIVRESINSLGYILNEEEIIYDEGKYYITMEFIKGKKKYSKKELFFGPKLLDNKDEMFYKYYSYLKDIYINIFKSIPKDNIERKKEIEKQIKILENI